MVIPVNEDGPSYTEAENFLALTMTCKQIREESKAYVPEVCSFLIEPDLQPSESGNQVMHKPFNLDKWLDTMITLPKMRPKIVMLHIGRFDQAVVGNATADIWQPEWEGILPLIPRPRPRSDVACTLYIHATVREQCTGMIKFSFPIELRGDPVEPCAPNEQQGRAIIETVVGAKKRLLKTLLMDDWAGLTSGELARERRNVWTRLHSTEKVMLDFLCALRHGPQPNYFVGRPRQWLKNPLRKRLGNF